MKPCIYEIAVLLLWLHLYMKRRRERKKYENQTKFGNQAEDSVYGNNISDPESTVLSSCTFREQ